jgi:bifunctional DNA-binding transcriptional regulator/antitoxin component of YhaV-PrlF toxin-antitoxin module
MKQKLNKFSDFANSLYPHEIEYLLSVQQFAISDNLKILNLINYNSKNPLNIIPYDTSLDKRKYSYLKNWIEKNLLDINVDRYFEWLLNIEKQVMMDAVTPEEEKELLAEITKTSDSSYYFIRFYELLQHYRDYLLIRVRNQLYEPVLDYLNKYRESYSRSTEINKKLNSATIDIIKQHASTTTESKQWEKFLKKTFLDEKLDGFTRYRSIVRLTFLYYNYREFDKLKDIYSILDKMFKTNVFYSKRILANYYANRAMMHSKLNELDLAEKYGYLSIRQHNSDYLFYLLNLCGVLLKKGKNKEAYQLMSDSIPELKKTSSYYNKIGFVSFYINTLLANQYIDKAVSYAETFFNGYKKEILKHRWHLFFSSYIRALFQAKKFVKLLSITKRYNLVNKEKQNIGRAKYLPILFWYSTAADYLDGNISEDQLEAIIIKSGQSLIKHKYKSIKIMELINELNDVNPLIFKKIRGEINL